MTQAEIADWMGYVGTDAVAQMNSHHDRLHEALAQLTGGPSHSLGVARGEVGDHDGWSLGNYEEDAVLHLQRYLVRSARMDAFLGRLER